MPINTSFSSPLKGKAQAVLGPLYWLHSEFCCDELLLLSVVLLTAGGDIKKGEGPGTKDEKRTLLKPNEFPSDDRPVSHF